MNQGCSVSIYVSDVKEWAAKYSGSPFHAVLTDPPYHLGEYGFMRTDWDKGGVSFDPETWKAIGQHLYPGGLLLAFAGSYNFHRITMAIEEAGFDIYPMIAWIYGQGIGLGRKYKDQKYDGYRYGKQALKPALEPIICAAKRISSTYGETMEQYGTGGFNIAGVTNANQFVSSDRSAPGYPSNVVATSSAINFMQEESGKTVSRYFQLIDDDEIVRAFYVPKPSRRERDLGIDAPETKVGVYNSRQRGEWNNILPKGKNDHPTVKPISLTKSLANLLLPPDAQNARILIPFCGTGSEIIGAIQSGWHTVVGIEIKERYAAMASMRINAHTKTIVEIFQ